MKKIIAIISVFMAGATLCACIKTNSNIDNYAEDIEAYAASAFMPTLDDINEYEDVEYFSRKDNGIFPEYSMQLVVKYDEENFSAEKERLETAYTYLDEPQKLDDTHCTIPVKTFSAAGFDFKIAKFEDTVYPKNFGMVGLSDESCEIAYLWLYAPDLDYICQTDADEIKEMNEFIAYYFSLE